jgi:hypothetical protein
MPIDLTAARRFLHASARVLDLHRTAHLLDDGSAGKVVDALRAYRNDDGGFGHGLEPDVRDPHSQTSATMTALGILAELGADDGHLLAGAMRWLEGIANADGGLPTVLPTAAAFPAAPWMVPSAESGFLTYPTVAALQRLGASSLWLERATQWCWRTLETSESPAAYTVKFGLVFLDATHERDRAEAVIDRLGTHLRADGTIPVEGGVEGEHITPLVLSPEPGLASRRLFGGGQVTAGLDALEAAQQEDGGWDFDFLHWSPAQTVEWRGLTTLEALRTLRAHGRL